jgi:hypothetical protein
MSERTANALSKLDALLASLGALSKNDQSESLIQNAEALRRAVAAFHMEAIRFRMYSVDRDLKTTGDPADARHIFEELRHALEEAGFHTRSHTAP